VILEENGNFRENKTLFFFQKVQNYFSQKTYSRLKCAESNGDNKSFVYKLVNNWLISYF
jgi:hypothetical protein